MDCKRPGVEHHASECLPPLVQCVELHVCRLSTGPLAMQYSLHSNCLVTLDPGPSRWQQGQWENHLIYSGQINIVDLGAGGRVLCRATDPMCALPAPAPLRSSRVRHSHLPARCSAQGRQHLDGIHTARWRLWQRGGRRLYPLW